VIHECYSVNDKGYIVTHVGYIVVEKSYIATLAACIVVPEGWTTTHTGYIAIPERCSVVLDIYEPLFRAQVDERAIGQLASKPKRRHAAALGCAPRVVVDDTQRRCSSVEGAAHAAQRVGGVPGDSVGHIDWGLRAPKPRGKGPPPAPCTPPPGLRPWTPKWMPSYAEA
jgi:hypothetical protein